MVFQSTLKQVAPFQNTRFRGAGGGVWHPISTKIYREFYMNVIPMRDPDRDQTKAHVTTLTRALCTWFVQRDCKFFDVTNLNTALSAKDVQRIAVARFRDEFGDVPQDSNILKAVFARAMGQTHNHAEETIAIWGGRRACLPGNPERIIVHRGVAAINTWSLPDYRRVGVTEADYGVAGAFFAWLLPREAEREMVLNWLAWNLQHEADRPTWAPFLYSRTKGSGKSTFAALVAKLFGETNSVTQNSVDGLVGRFNMTSLHSKLVIAEELQLKQDGPQANALKTFITEGTTLAEFKGREAERVAQWCCFLLTTNHLPLWIEAQDRRYYVVEIDHDGHAAGTRSAEFASLVDRLKRAMADPVQVAKLYNALMTKPLPDTFDAKTLNVVRDATDVMKRIHEASRQVTVEQVEEHLNSLGVNVMPEAELARFVQEKLRGNVNAIRHTMTELGWLKQALKWGGKDYARAIWVRPGFSVDRGRVHGLNGWSQGIDDHLNATVYNGIESF
jgi:hypothetical protein